MSLVAVLGCTGCAALGELQKDAQTCPSKIGEFTQTGWAGEEHPVAGGGCSGIVYEVVSPRWQTAGRAYRPNSSRSASASLVGSHHVQVHWDLDVSAREDALLDQVGVEPLQSLVAELGAALLRPGDEAQVDVQGMTAIRRHVNFGRMR